MNSDGKLASLSCPVPFPDYPAVTLAHGAGGSLTHHLVRSAFLPHFANPHLDRLHDGAVVDLSGEQIAFSTDSYVVDPIFFPGGDIGELAVNGTVNDLAMCGAQPLYLAAGFIIEEGFPLNDLEKVARSMARAAGSAGVLLVTGDTKVVDRGKGDKLFINTSGIGSVYPGVRIDPSQARAGDKIILSGRIGEHGVAILSVREGLEFETQIRSDTAALNGLVESFIGRGADIHVLRDPTRGGVATTLNEIAGQGHVGIAVEESLIPVGEEVRAACEILGLDPLYVANEGKLLAIVERNSAEAILESMKAHPLGKEAAIIGEVVEAHPGIVTMKCGALGSRIVEMIAGEQLPRIC